MQAMKYSFGYNWKHVLRVLQLYGDQVLQYNLGAEKEK